MKKQLTDEALRNLILSILKSYAQPVTTWWISAALGDRDVHLSLRDTKNICHELEAETKIAKSRTKSGLITWEYVRQSGLDAEQAVLAHVLSAVSSARLIEELERRGVSFCCACKTRAALSPAL